MRKRFHVIENLLFMITDDCNEYMYTEFTQLLKDDYLDDTKNKNKLLRVNHSATYTNYIAAQSNTSKVNISLG